MKFSISPDPIPGGHAGIDARLKLGPRIHSTAYVAPGATVIGDVTLMEESSVWYGAVLRGDINRIIIGPRSNVQDNAVVHIDTPNETRLGELVTVGHSAIVHACIIDDEVLIGMGAIILDGAEIGARSIIGANALVTLGTKIPPGSLVLGSPAKVKRALTLEEQKDIARWAWSYVETSKRNEPGLRTRLACCFRRTAETIFLEKSVHFTRGTRDTNWCDALIHQSMFRVDPSSRARSRNNSRACGIEPPSS